MTQLSRFLDGPTYGSQDFAEFFTNFLSTGFFQGLQVQATNSMRVNVAAGSAFIEGYEYRNTDNLLIEHNVADVTQKRIDRVVVRLDRTPNAEQHITALVRNGAPADNPQPPALVRNESIYEISLAQVTVEAGKSFIEQYQIKDERGDVKVCGRVTHPSKLTNQIDSVDVKTVNTPPQQFAEGVTQFYLSGSDHSEIMQAWLNSIGVAPGDYGKNITSLRAYIMTVGNKTNTAVQTFTLFAWDVQSNYRIYGEWKRANNAISPTVAWGRWQEAVFIVEKGNNANGHFVKYSDGYMECWTNHFRASTDVAVGSLYRSETFYWTFPAAFDDRYQVDITGDISAIDRFVGMTGPTAGGSAPIRAYCPYSSSTEYTVYLRAFGRWR